MNFSVSTPHTSAEDVSRHRIEVISVQVTSNGVTVGFRLPSCSMYLTGPPRRAPDKVWKEVYTVGADPVDGTPALGLIKVIEGKHIPVRELPSTIEWPDET